MNVFPYLSNNRSIHEQYQIYKAVRALENYAMSIYGSGWEDALDCAFFHILENYNPEKGNLENYTIRVVKTVDLNKNKDEYADDEKTQLGLDMKSAREYSENKIDLIFEDDKSEDIASCIRDLVDLYAKDYKFFITNNPKDRKESYSKIFKTYSNDIILEAKNYLVNKYNDTMKDFISTSKSSDLRNYDSSRYLKSVDTNTSYISEINDIILIKRKKSSHVKYIYRVNIEETIDSIIRTFYDSGVGVLFIEHISVYLTMSGKVVISMSELRSSLEDELVGSLLSRTSLKVLDYERGKRILFTSTKDSQYNVMFTIFGRKFVVEFESVVAKEV